MTEDGAQDWLRDHYGAVRLDRLSRFVSFLLTANAEQNLISKGSEAHVWVRHILDSAQLQQWAPHASDWLDVGSGAGLPGLVLAIISDAPILLVEPRRKRAAFLEAAIEALALGHASVRQSMIERMSGFSVGAITARAYAPLPELFVSTVQLTHSSTIWVLPKGRSAEAELAAARKTWQAMFHVEHSLTDPDARIIVASGVRSRCA